MALLSALPVVHGEFRTRALQLTNAMLLAARIGFVQQIWQQHLHACSLHTLLHRG